MKKSCLFTLFVLIVLSFGNAFAQNTRTLNIYFYEQPLLFRQGEKPQTYEGIEADIIQEFISWCAEKKKISVKPAYFAYKSFKEFYDAMKTAPPNTLGAGTVTITKERLNEFDCTAPYLKNVAVFVSHGSLNTLDTEQPETLRGINVTGLAESQSIHVEYMKAFQKRYAPDMEIKEIKENIGDVLASDPKYVAYMDIIKYRYLTLTSDTYFKIHRSLSKDNEKFGFILPKESDWTVLVNEFMESGFGFTSTKKYHQILEKYLGYEVIRTVEIN
jgi:putative glutamine transport system substrate-binding protein